MPELGTDTTHTPDSVGRTLKELQKGLEEEHQYLQKEIAARTHRLGYIEEILEAIAPAANRLDPNRARPAPEDSPHAMQYSEKSY